MGSYLSIVNDTQGTWMCTTGQEGKTDDMNAIVTNVVAAIYKVFRGVAAVAPIVSSLTPDGNVAVLNVPASALVPVAPGTAIADAHANLVGSPSDFNVAVAQLLSEYFTNDGFEAIAPGGNYRWGKYTLNLYRESTCVKWVIRNEKTVHVETLYKRPMYSGSTKDSNNKYAIQSWLKQYGTKSFDVEGFRPVRVLREDTDETNAEALPSADKLFYVDANGTKTVDK